MDTATCPHCGVANELDASFCISCGKALPGRAEAGGPQIVEGSALAGTTAGQSLQEEELRKQSRKAAGALLAVAILQCLFGVLLLVVGRAMLGGAQDVELDRLVFVVVFAIGLIFFGLFWWARHNPLPAAITGLVLFVTVHLLDALADPTALARGIIVKVIIIVVLARAISAGVRHRKLRQEMQLA
jgi:hypothetical protein